LPSQASILPITASHVPALRRINSLLLSVPYPDSFYAALLDPSASGLLSRAILWRDTPASDPKVIGGIVCRLEPSSTNPTTHAIYLQSLALLSPYRAQGLAAAALEHIVSSAVLLPPASWDVQSVYAHVWTENEDGLRWYAARGFQREGREPVRRYYYKLRPDTAWIVR
ncbi:acyl-CoA N-acyltransferase, partial [Schizothecium vesticola]